MPQRTKTRRLGRIRRRTFAANLLGLAGDRPIGPLKEYLHAAGLTTSPTEKLDLVMLEDFDHYAELLAAQGIPLARDDAESDPVPYRVTIQLRIGWAVILGAFVVGLLADDLVALLTGFDIIPWF